MAKAELFDAWPERYEEWFSTPIGKLIREIEGRLVMEMLAPGRGDTILDAGCGTGVFTTDMLAKGARVVGLDISAPMLQYALSKTPDYPFMPVRADIRQLPFKSNFFDKVVSITALEFVAEGQMAVDELFRVTKPGGVVVVATLNSLSPWAARRRAKTVRGEGHILEDAYYRSPNDLLALSQHKGVAGTVIHFENDADPAQAIKTEEAGKRRKLDTGAFEAVRWQKPR